MAGTLGMQNQWGMPTKLIKNGYTRNTGDIARQNLRGGICPECLPFISVMIIIIIFHFLIFFFLEKGVASHLIPPSKHRNPSL